MFFRKKKSCQDAHAEYDLAMTLIKEGNLKKGLKLLKSSAVKGDSDAQFQLGCSILEGKITAPLIDGVNWLLKASEHNHMLALNNLSICYSQGIGVKQDPKIAFSYLEKAANLGDYMAKFNIGQQIFFGVFLEQDILKGFDIMLTVANANIVDPGVALAALTVAKIYANGYYIDPEQYIDTHRGKALLYFKKAAEYGNSEALSILNSFIATEDESKGIDTINYAFPHDSGACIFQKVFETLKIREMKTALSGDFVYSVIQLGDDYKHDMVVHVLSNHSKFIYEIKKDLINLRESDGWQFRMRKDELGAFELDTVCDNKFCAYKFLTRDGNIIWVLKVIMGNQQTIDIERLNLIYKSGCIPRKD